MGLAEKRRVKELKETTIPERTKDFKDEFGLDIAYDVDWDSFATLEELNFMDNISCHRIAMAIRMISGDAQGKEALKQMQTIKLRNVKTIGEKSLEYAHGVLSIASCYAWKLDGAFTEYELKSALEARGALDSLGINERRKIDELTSKVLPERTKELHEIIGCDRAQYEVDFSSFKTEEELTFMDNISCHRINIALRSICWDDTGKEAMLGLKTIKLKNVPTIGQKSLSYAAGVLSIASCYSWKLDGAFSEYEIQACLEARGALDSMGIKERRKMAEIEDKVLPERTKELHEIIGCDAVSYEVDFASFKTEEELNYLDNISCHRIAMAARMICSDDMGKEAMQEVKKIKLKNVPTIGEKSLTYASGVLSIASCYSWKLDGAFTEYEIRDLLEASF